MEKRILIFGPIGDFGGRELESGFIASVLSSKFDVAICSSGTISEKSQFFDFNKGLNVFSVNQLLFDKYWIIRILAYLSFLKNKSKGIISSYSNNLIIKRFFNYEKKTQIVLDELISDYDLIFICAQLTSGLIDEVIKISKDKGKKVIFRTTGAITEIDFAFITEVDCFIHHSLNNAKRIEDYKPHRYEIIDQCAYHERDLLKIPILKSNVKTFLTVSRLVKEKNIDVIIKAFQKSKRAGDRLFVIGDGLEYDNLLKIAAVDEDVIFTGLVSNADLYKYFSFADCVIISYFELETGPLTGIEAMAASRLIISSRTGAMQERIPFNNFWHNNTESDIVEQINLVKQLNNVEIFEMSKNIRNRYLQEYSLKNIAHKYLDIVEAIVVN
ncbi:Glycosyltransferase involved in cell wall bisynthesis [Flavobacterium succinicans]|uniref:Glycosyltransferase involved in cell wall bisynthesis n=1 Tax=Flavobacterium succinicans TaxID=29536 RepID=A0A1I4SH07_9FLAO|nr:glycosyltransferase family 4 protein [Flavobacterium succinicans]SFM63583.1 Glycosyltransferase involved in cell wall bisynthesis [Flavobacterium succinicans]